MEKHGKKISLIIPAHNEEANLGRVLDIVTKIDFDEILVVADACQDKTAELAIKYGTKVLVRPVTKGKGDAMIDGVKHTDSDVIMFVDADLENLTVEHVEKVLQPVLSESAVMSIGLRDRIFGLSAVMPKIMPMYAIGGERAMTREFFNSIPKDENVLDFGIETVMNFYAKRRKLPVATPVLKNLHQVIKEKKWGFWPGLKSRFGLMGQVWRTRFIMKHKKSLK